MNERAQRIIEIMQDKKMNAKQFAEAIGNTPGNISHIMTERHKPSANMITQILSRFDDINSGWLLFGQGAMKKNASVLPEEPMQVDNHHQETPIQTEVQHKDEKRYSERVKPFDNYNKFTEKEIVIAKNNAVKTIEKLIIFYSDQTYETFIPEINKGDI